MREYISHFYGVLVDGFSGVTSLWDPLLPPKRCPLNCEICPLGRGAVVERSSAYEADVTTFKGAISSRASVLVGSDSALVWGMGDPLLISNIGDIIGEVRRFLEERGVPKRLIIHTSGPTLSRALRGDWADKVDEIRVPFLWYSDALLAGWNEEIDIAGYYEVLKLFNKRYPGRLVIELYAYRVGHRASPSPEELGPVAGRLRAAGVEKVRVLTIERPSANERARPLPPAYLNVIVEKLENEGLRVEPRKAFSSKALEIAEKLRALYNQLLRIPLSTNEVLELYGDEGLIALNNLIERGKAVKIPWEGRIFYRAVY